MLKLQYPSTNWVDANGRKTWNSTETSQTTETASQSANASASQLMQIEISVIRFVIEGSKNTRHCAERLENREGLLGEYQTYSPHSHFSIPTDEVSGWKSSIWEKIPLKIVQLKLMRFRRPDSVFLFPHNWSLVQSFIERHVTAANTFPYHSDAERNRAYITRAPWTWKWVYTQRLIRACWLGWHECRWLIDCEMRSVDM